MKVNYRFLAFVRHRDPALYARYTAEIDATMARERRVVGRRANRLRRGLRLGFNTKKK
jgi:hypothetical protein